MRYIIPEDKDEDNYWQIIDTETGKKVLFHISLIQTRDICKLLNHLADENEQLMKDMSTTHIKNRELQIRNLQLTHENSLLIEENKQLNKDLCMERHII